jgi:hypothetical protein
VTDTAAPAKPSKAPKTALNATRSFWLKQPHQWRWISAAFSLIGPLLFAVTGITLNHAVRIPAEPGGDGRLAIAATARYVVVMEVLS